jgi:hypothetical protein
MPLLLLLPVAGCSVPRWYTCRQQARQQSRTELQVLKLNLAYAAGLSGLRYVYPLPLIHVLAHRVQLHL